MFDPRAAKALKPGDLLTLEAAPGLRLVATATTRTWVYRYKSPVDGLMRQVRIGHWPAVGLPAALAAWERLRDQRNSGSDPAAERRGTRHKVAAEAAEARYTVLAAVGEYLEAYESSVAQKTYAEAARLLRTELSAIEARPVATVTRAEAFDLIESMRSRPVVARRVRQLLGAVWDRALDAGRLPPEVPNWWRLVMRGKLPSKGKIVGGEHQGAAEKRVLSAGEISQLLSWLPNFTRDVGDALMLYLWTACRGSEICAMERTEITQEGDGWWWTVPRAKLKMRRNPLTTDLRVPLVGRAQAVVMRRLAAGQASWLFPSRSRSGHIEQKALGVAIWTHMPGCTLRPEWERPRLPVSNWAPHDLRRSSRTLLAALGCPAEIAELILGHLPPAMQAIYNRHGYDAERRQWLTRLSERLDELGGPDQA